MNFAFPHSTIFPRYGEPRIDYISDFLLGRSPLNGTCEGMWINLYLHDTATSTPVLAFVDYDTRGSPRDLIAPSDSPQPSTVVQLDAWLGPDRLRTP